MGFNPKEPRDPFGKWMGRAGRKMFVGRMAAAERRRRVQGAHAEARKFLTGEKRPEWHSPQMIAAHGGRWNRDPHEAYQSELDGQLRWAFVHPQTAKYYGDAERRRLLAKKLSPEAKKGRALRMIRSRQHG